MMKTIIRVLCLLPVLGFAFQAQAQTRAAPKSQEQLQLSFAPVVKQVSPAVVNIYTKRIVTRTYNPFMSDPFFAPFFGGSPFGQRLRKQAESSLGSGFIVDPKGLIVTNAHVIAGTEDISVELSDGRVRSAQRVGADRMTDIAVIRIDPDPAVVRAFLGGAPAAT